MRSFYLGHWIPSYAAVVLITLSGMALILQARRAAATLFLLGLGSVVMPPILEALWPVAGETARLAPDMAREVAVAAGWPPWMSILILLGLVLGLLRLVLGRDLWIQIIGQWLGTILSDITRFLFLAPFRAVAALIRLLFYRRSSGP